jgi:hydrogenase small subunit
VVKALPKGGFVLAVEGSIPENEAFCMLGDGAGKEGSALKKFLALAEKASLILSVGTCASFGGIPAGAPNPGRYMPVSEIASKNGVKTPIVNVPGCPPHPNWITTAIAEFLLAGGVQGMKLDALGRPVSVYGHLIHENCPRRAFFDEGKFAKKPGDPECLFKVGCKGPITYADCPLREWNNGQNWCVKAGAPCQGCTQPEFIDQTTPIYVGLPEDALPKIGERK